MNVPRPGRPWQSCTILQYILHFLPNSAEDGGGGGVGAVAVQADKLWLITFEFWPRGAEEALGNRQEKLEWISKAGLGASQRQDLELASSRCMKFRVPSASSLVMPGT